MKRHAVVPVVVAVALALAALAVAAPVAAEGGVAPAPPSPVSIDLKSAEARDVLQSFAEITGLEVAVVMGVEVRGRVTATMTDAPWPEVLTEVLSQVGLAWDLAGDYIVVHAP